MSAWSPSGVAYLFDQQCGVPHVNWVDNENGEDIVNSCATIEASFWSSLLLGLSIAFFVGALVSTTQAASVVTWTAVALPLAASLCVWLLPFFAVRDFRATASNFESSGMDKQEWSVVSNANGAAQANAVATLVAGALVLSGLVSVATALR